VLRLSLDSADGSHVAQLQVDITVSGTTLETAAQTGVKEATSASEQLNSVPTTAIDGIQSNTQTFQTTITPTLNNVMSIPRLDSILKSLKGFMEIADFIADVRTDTSFGPQGCE
jgi:transcription termination factor NusB